MKQREGRAGLGDAGEREGLGFVFFCGRGGGAEGDGYGLGWGVWEASFTGGFTGCALGGTAFFAGDHMCVAPVKLRWSQRSELGLIFAWGGCRAELAFKAGFCKWLRGKEKGDENIFQRFVNVFGGSARGLVCAVFR